MNLSIKSKVDSIKLIANDYRHLNNRYVLQICKGILRQSKLKNMRKKFQFDNWHVMPKELRPYSIDIIEHINSNVSGDKMVVEIGCGLGEIIRNINCTKLYGYDVCEKVINAAKYLDKNRRVNYMVGSFEHIKDFDIDYLISVNFIHELAPEYLKEAYRKACTSNKIKNIVVDYVGSSNYKYNHDFESIIPDNFKITYESPEYASKRRILVYSLT